MQVGIGSPASPSPAVLSFLSLPSSVDQKGEVGEVFGGSSARHILLSPLESYRHFSLEDGTLCLLLSAMSLVPILGQRRHPTKHLLVGAMLLYPDLYFRTKGCVPWSLECSAKSRFKNSPSAKENCFPQSHSPFWRRKPTTND